MNEERLSVREARMELDFALVEGDKDKIAAAQARLEKALVGRERRRRESEREKNGFSKAA